MTKKEIIELLKDKPDKSWLFYMANETRKKHCGNGIYLRGLVEFSNFCKKDCVYCGLRSDNTKVQRYRMSETEIFNTAAHIAKLNFKTIVLQSGEDPLWNAKRLAPLISKIKKETKLAITLSIGELPKDDYFKLKAAGADRFLMRFETSDLPLFSYLKPASSYKKRIKHLKWLTEAGFQMGSGIMTGLPGQSIESIADDILLLRDLDLDMIGIGPFIPNLDTPLALKKGNNLLLSLKTLAIIRIVCGKVHIPATSAMEALDPNGREKALQCGANVVMPNITPKKFKKDYLLYPGKICIEEDSKQQISRLNKMFKKINRYTNEGYGDSLKKPSEE
jgi:biotin synthase